MTEKEYINATNLAKVRSAKNVLRDYYPMNAREEKAWQSAMNAMCKIEERLTRIVATTV